MDILTFELTDEYRQLKSIFSVYKKDLEDFLKFTNDNRTVDEFVENNSKEDRLDLFDYVDGIGDGENGNLVRYETVYSDYFEKEYAGFIKKNPGFEEECRKYLFDPKGRYYFIRFINPDVDWREFGYVL